MFFLDSKKNFELCSSWSRPPPQKKKNGDKATCCVVLQAREFLGLLTSNPVWVPSILVRHQNGGSSGSGVSSPKRENIQLTQSDIL